MQDPKQRAEALTHRAALDRKILKLAPGAVRDIAVRQRDRIPIADPDSDPPGVTPTHPGPGDSTMPRVNRPWRPDDRIPIPELDQPPRLDPCSALSGRAASTLAESDNRWWQNWGKTCGYIAERMFFPTSVYELSEAILRAEADNRPVRAVGGGWSFSDVNIPGDATSSRPAALGVEVQAELVALTERFPADPLDPVIASVAAAPTTPPADSAGSIAMLNPENDEIDTRWVYFGAGVWWMTEEAKRELIRKTMPYVGLLEHVTDAEYVAMAYEEGFRPVTTAGPDVAGSLAMVSVSSGGFVDAFYNGKGMWTFNPFSPRPSSRQFKEFPPHRFRPQVSTPAWSMGLFQTPQPVCLINTQSMASSLQQSLPSILSAEALALTTPTLLTRARKHYFHVEGGITMEALSELLEHQSPRLAIEATGGNPGATLAGSLATGTHGGEYTRPLLSDRIKAVHFVGPGGLQWWIEGADSIADPDKLIARYPCLARERIITAGSRVGDLTGQDWLDAVVVSLGCMGAIYSLVLEVVPLFGIHEAAVETSWTQLLSRARFNRRPITQIDLRSDHSDVERRALGAEIFRLLADGQVNGTHIRREDNLYIDLAIDPNPMPTLHPFGLFDLFERFEDVLTDGVEYNWKCWVLNREKTWSVPFDAKPSPKDMIGRIGKKLDEMIKRPDIARRLEDVFDVDFITRFKDHDFADAIILAAHQIPDALERADKWLQRLVSSADTIDTALDIRASTIDQANDSIVAGAFVSAVFSGLLGIENGRHDSTAVASKVGAIGFPASGIMGTSVEIALPAEEAWPFLQTEILDRIERPFFGYISVRICPEARAHLGMQQWAPTIMIEVVAFGTLYARTFVADLQGRTIERIRGGLDAMLHWGLENDQLDADALRSIPALNGGAVSKLTKFVMARQHLKSAAPTAPDVFDNATTRRLNL